MTGMSGTFACPHCGAQYPIKPVLVGRAVRCTTCKKPFRLRPDGVADKVEDQATAPEPAAPPSPAPATTQPASVEPISEAPAAQQTAKPQSRSTRTDRVNRDQMEAQRKSMAATLATAANAALEAETVKRDQAAEAKPKRSSKNKEGRVGEIGPAVLTGFGEHEHRNNMLWLFGSIGIIGGLVIAFALFSLRSEERKALDAFTAVVEGERSRYGERMLAIQERAWLTGVAPLIDLGTVTVGSGRSLTLSGLSEVLAPLKNLAWISAHQLWVASDKSAEVEKLWDAQKGRGDNLNRLKQARIDVVDANAVVAQLSEAGWNEDDGQILLRMLTGTSTRSGDNWIAKKLLSGELPQAIEICPFHGTSGKLLDDLGRSYRPRDVDYEGLLLRFVGGGWPGEWRVFSIVTTSQE